MPWVADIRRTGKQRRHASGKHKDRNFPPVCLCPEVLLPSFLQSQQAVGLHEQEAGAAQAALNQAQTNVEPLYEKVGPHSALAYSMFTTLPESLMASTITLAVRDLLDSPSTHTAAILICCVPAKLGAIAQWLSG